MKTLFTIFFSMVLLASAVAADKKTSESALTTLGYTNNVQRATVGPYSAVYAEKKNSSLFLVNKEKHNVVFCRESENTAIYRRGVPWLTYDTDANGNPTNLSLAILSEDNTAVTVMIDDEVDGQWDKKLDFKTKKTFVWRDNKWNEEE